MGEDLSLQEGLHLPAAGREGTMQAPAPRPENAKSGHTTVLTQAHLRVPGQL